jgi:hypothetical protein
MEKLNKLIAKAKEQGIEIEMVQDLIDENHLDSLWYGGTIARITKGRYCIALMAMGDVRATLYDENKNEIAYVKDKGNYGRFYEEMADYIKNDKHMYELEHNGQLVFDNNNWFEWSVYDTEEEEYIGPDCFDNILEEGILDFLEVDAINALLDYVIEYESDGIDKDFEEMITGVNNDNCESI